MIGIGVRASGGDLEILELDAPRAPREGELLLDIISAGVGPWDPLLHTGGWDVALTPPAALGVEGVGRVTEVGPGGSAFQVGDVVLVHEAPLPGGSGTWAQQVLVRASSAARLPVELTADVAAGLPVAGLTALQALDALGVSRITRLLVVGASGPTAALAVQLAALRHADVVAGAGPAHAEKLKAFGARAVIDTHVAGWADAVEDRFDAVLIAAEGTAEDAIGLVVDGGRLVSITSDAPASVRGITTSDLYIEPDGEALAELATLADDGSLTLEVEATDYADGIAVAQRVGAGRSGGVKHVLRF